jgi:L-rhamnose isomerase
LQESKIKQNYLIAKEQLAELGVDTQSALDILSKISISLHCWQGDDVGGFEFPNAELSGGGIQVVGNYPGKARSINELQSDLEKAYSLIPGSHRLNLHAIYGDFSTGYKNRNEVGIDNFKIWIDWAKQNNLKLDFNSTIFSHEKAEDGFTLSHQDKSIRDFWIEHVKRCREIASCFGKELQSPSIHNLWIPDGSKDFIIDRMAPRQRLKESLDEIYSIKYNSAYLKDSVESKLFGIGSEYYVVGSHEFYIGYALKNDLMLCIDTGHFHPTESVADKISSILIYSPEVLLHLSRGVRWDSDHVVILSDDLKDICAQLVRNNLLDRVRIAFDYFDATINRIGAWVIGFRATQKALLNALLEPTRCLKEYEDSGRLFDRLANLEEIKSIPIGAIWDYFCLINDVPSSHYWIDEVNKYEDKIQSQRH